MARWRVVSFSAMWMLGAAVALPGHAADSPKKKPAAKLPATGAAKTAAAKTPAAKTTVAAASKPAPPVKLDPKGVDFFEKKIRPVLAKNCYACHSATAKEVKGGLLLDTRAGLLKGG